MRFKEFIILKEQAGQFYTVGDSHAHAVGQMGGKDWVNLAVGGASSKGTHPKIQQMLGNISKIPKDSVVLISLGANDTANAMVPGKPSRSAASIAADVAGVVDRVRAQGPSKIIFLLFPNGPGRGSKDAKFYGGEFQDEVRAAIKTAIGNVEIIDINGKPLTDGVHAGMSTYKEVANQVRAKGGAGVKLGPSDATPGAPPSKKIPVDDTLKAGPPFKPEDKDAVISMQKRLKELGYNIGPTGIDGKFGPYTVAALKAFQKDYKLTGDGTAFTKKDSDTITMVVTNKIARVEPSQQQSRIGKKAAEKPVVYDAVTKGRVGEVLNFVAGPESRGYYDMMFGSVRKPEILKMTMVDANKFQHDWFKQAGSSAMGRYQIMHFNTIDYARKAGLDPQKDKFTPENQDKMGIIFLKERGLDRWLSGRMSDQDFLEGLAQVWAGLPAPSKGGNSYYGGVGLNRHEDSIKYII